MVREGLSMSPEPKYETVWVFNGVRNHFSSGVFRSKRQAEDWINRPALVGTLTEYPLDVGIYEWAIQSGAFVPKHEHHHSPGFIGNFSSAAQQHIHYEAESG